MGILAVCGNIISTLTAHFSGYKYDDIKNGLYGFNGTLVGIAVGVFLQLSVGSLIMLIIASALSTWIAYFFNQQRLIPGFTAPFILAVWGMLGVCSWLIPDLLSVSYTVIDTTQNINYFQAFCLGIYNPQIQISAESETKRSIFREKDKTKRSKKESAQHSKSRNKSFVMTSVSAL